MDVPGPDPMLSEKCTNLRQVERLHAKAKLINTTPGLLTDELELEPQPHPQRRHGHTLFFRTGGRTRPR